MTKQTTLFGLPHGNPDKKSAKTKKGGDDANQVVADGPESQESTTSLNETEETQVEPSQSEDTEEATQILEPVAPPEVS